MGNGAVLSSHFCQKVLHIQCCAGRSVVMVHKPLARVPQVEVFFFELRHVAA